jgi:hypothetical protein
VKGFRFINVISCARALETPQRVKPRPTKVGMKTPFSVECRARCEVRLSELSPADIANLTEFAERSLKAKGLNPSAGEDVTQRALVAILRGLESDQGGRMPRLVNLENKETFLNFVRGAVSSIAYAMGRSPQSRTDYEPWQDSLAVVNAEDPLTPAKDAELSDLRDQLFLRLRARAPRCLTRTIDAWEPVFTESDRIPSPGHRVHVVEVKRLAQEIITELGGIR